MEAQPPFICEPAKSGRAKCSRFGCRKKIDKGELRLGEYVLVRKKHFLENIFVCIAFNILIDDLSHHTGE